MTKIKVLAEGYFKELSETRCKAGSTIVLVQDEGKNILVDTGNPQDKYKILTSLKKLNITPENIDFVFITHFHPDHTGCNYLFSNARFVVPGVAFWEDKFDRSPELQKITKNVKMISTPGHSEDSSTLLVKTPRGIFACVGDLFWFEGDEKVDLLEKDCSNKKLFYENRKKLLKTADYIIPGHGKMFRTNRINKLNNKIKN